LSAGKKFEELKRKKKSRRHSGRHSRKGGADDRPRVFEMSATSRASGSILPGNAAARLQEEGGVAHDEKLKKKRRTQTGRPRGERKDSAFTIVELDGASNLSKKTRGGGEERRRRMERERERSTEGKKKNKNAPAAPSGEFEGETGWCKTARREKKKLDCQCGKEKTKRRKGTGSLRQIH